MEREREEGPSGARRVRGQGSGVRARQEARRGARRDVERWRDGERGCQLPLRKQLSKFSKFSKLPQMKPQLRGKWQRVARGTVGRCELVNPPSVNGSE